ncbi:MAG: EipB family protein, partial [Methylocella sp.]
MFACHARILFLTAFTLALAAPGPSPLSAAAANSATANAAPQPATIDITRGTFLVPHRAVYELTLLKSVGSKSPTAAHGLIAFDFNGSACDGYVQNFRQLTELQPAEGPTRVSDMHSAT